MSLTVPQITGPPTPHSSLGTVYGYAMPTTGPWASHHFVKVAEDTSAKTVDFDLQYVGVAGVPNALSTIRFNYGTGVWSDVHTADDPDFFSLTANGTYTSSLTITADNTDIHLNRGNGQYLGYFTLSGWTPSSGGGNQGTLSVSVNSIFIESNGAWVGGTIADSEPTGSYPVTLNSNLVTTAISHTNGTETPFSIAILDRFGTWHLHQNYVTSALNTPIASVLVSATTRKRKACCNFW